MQKTMTPLPLGERLLKWTIIGTGIVCFLLLCWSHLGLGAWVIPPAPVAAQQTAVAGTYQVHLTLTSGQQLAKGPNTIALVVRDGAGQPLTNVSVRLRFVMTTMAMNAPEIQAQSNPSGTYLAHPLYGMAGDWHVIAVITAPQATAEQAEFTVSVRWS